MPEKKHSKNAGKNMLCAFLPLNTIQLFPIYNKNLYNCIILLYHFLIKKKINMGYVVNFSIYEILYNIDLKYILHYRLEVPSSHPGISIQLGLILVIHFITNLRII